MVLNKSEICKAKEEVFVPKEGKTKEKGRISNSINVNIASRKDQTLFNSLKEEDQNKLSLSDDTHYVNRKGKEVSISVEEIQIIKALSSYLPFDDPEIKAYITELNTMDSQGRCSNGTLRPLQIPVSVLQLSKDIIGNTKEASLKKMAERLERLEQIEQVQTFYVDGKKFSLVRPLIRFGEKIYQYYSEVRSTRGRKKTENPEVKEQKILVAANIIYSPLFLYEAANKFCPQYPTRLFKIWNRNKTELFAILLSDLESKFRQYYLNSLKEEQRAKKENKELKNSNREKYDKLIKEAKGKALVYKSSTATIRDRITTDYETTRMQRNRFIPDLQRAINSLIEYGIITERSFISKEKELVYFCYNPEFSQNEDSSLLSLEDIENI